jgi:L,D-peptidoglycan transpeptidase YkuD (ErfK/YbiS/YcfS/YnhG family)
LIVVSWRARGIAAVGMVLTAAGPTGATAAPPLLTPAWAGDVPATTTQVVRTVRTDLWCSDVWCTRTEAWERVDGRWRLAAGPHGLPAVFRSAIGPNGFGKQREGDGRTPSGVYRIVVTTSTDDAAPGRMPWRRRLPTSVVSEVPGPDYNTWLELPQVSTGDRPAMRYGFLVDYNNPRLTPGHGPAPVPGAGSGIFFHTSAPGHEFDPSSGCVRVGDPDQMRWIDQWLDPTADPRVVLDR